MSALTTTAVVALVAYIRSQDFLPPDLPELSPTFWKSVTTTETLPDAASRRSTPNEIYTVQGKRVLAYALFGRLVQMGDLLDKPAGYIEFIETVVLSEQVLREMLEKVDPRLLQNEVSTVLEGFYAFVAAHWNQAFCDMEHTKTWLSALFGPVMKEAGAFYVKNFKEPKTNLKAMSGKQDNLVFLQNLQNIQIPPEDPDCSFDSLTSSPGGTPPFRASPLNSIRPGILNEANRATPSKMARMMTLDGFIDKDVGDLNFLSALFSESDLPGPSALEEELSELEYHRDLAASSAGPSGDSLQSAFEISGFAYPTVFGSSNANGSFEHNLMATVPPFRLDHSGDFSNNGNLSLLNESGQSEVDEMTELFLNFDHLKIQEPSFSDLVGEGPHPLRRPLTPQNTIRTPGLVSVTEKGPEYVSGSITQV
ncbi:hypothetical protein B0H16DRAFT_1742462 [Mycena metata]|uniref:Uncharacterized protein n=1 Tax=Mycena metata TaxID=1033252 RepID=A0AAD7H815_9AGAR|nr:hypothetical protein B0H16DRAFT_1742462 [Mycena metata]